jgi:hypothetical protein
MLSQGTLVEAETWFRAAAEQDSEAASPSKFMMAEFLAWRIPRRSDRRHRRTRRAGIR